MRTALDPRFAGWIRCWPIRRSKFRGVATGAGTAAKAFRCTQVIPGVPGPGLLDPKDTQ